MVLLLIGGTSGAGAQAPRDYPEKAPLYYLTCLRQRTVQVDDRVSDARTIAGSVMPFCRARQLEYMRQYAPKSPVTEMLAQPARPQDMDFAVDVVLQVRAAKR